MILNRNNQSIKTSYTIAVPDIALFRYNRHVQPGRASRRLYIAVRDTTAEHCEHFVDLSSLRITAPSNSTFQLSRVNAGHL